MGWFKRKPNIRKMAIQLEAVENGLRLLAHGSKYVPSPKETEILAYIRWKLKDLPALADSTEKECWQRVNEYVNTPYTPAQLLWRRVASFFGWWICATFALAYTVLGWFVSWFPSPLHMFASSAVIGLVAVSIIGLQERKSRK